MNRAAAGHRCATTATSRTSVRSGWPRRSAAGPGERVLDLLRRPRRQGDRPGRRRAPPWWPPTSRPARVGLVVAQRRGARAGARPPRRRGGRRRRAAVPARRRSTRSSSTRPARASASLRRRADARWRIQPDDVDELAELQRALLDRGPRAGAPGRRARLQRVHARPRPRPSRIDEWLAATRPDVEALAPPASRGRRCGRGALLLPQAAGTDGMYLLRLRVPDGLSAGRLSP